MWQPAVKHGPKTLARAAQERLLHWCRTTCQWKGCEVKRFFGLRFLAVWLCCLPLHAQQQEPSEQAKRLAESPFRWIKINGARDKTEPKPGKPAVAKAGDRTAGPMPAPPVVRDEASDNRVGLAEEGKDGDESASQPQPLKASQPASAPLAEAKTAVAPAEPTPLRVVKRVLPEPPESLIRADVDDRVLVQFTVLADGSVADVKVMSSTNPKLNAHAVQAVGQWRYAAIEAPRLAQAAFLFTR